MMAATLALGSSSSWWSRSYRGSGRLGFLKIITFFSCWFKYHVIGLIRVAIGRRIIAVLSLMLEHFLV